MTPRLEDKTPRLFMLHDVLSAEECEHYVDLAETQGFRAAPITTALGPVMMPTVRNNTRVMIDSIPEAQSLWERVREHIPARWSELPAHEAVGLNERLRFYRYDPGQRFNVHRDGHFQRQNGERSFLTVLFFLNEGFKGGETRVIEPSDAATITPRKGSVLFFEHSLLHEGATLIEGRKYVLRSDLMYRAVM